MPAKKKASKQMTSLFGVPTVKPKTGADPYGQSASEMASELNKVAANQAAQTNSNMSSAPHVSFPTAVPIPEPASFQSSYADTLNAILKYSPDLAAQQFKQQAFYTPLQAQLATRMAQNQLPQQYATQLALQQQYLPQFQQVQMNAQNADIANQQAQVNKYASTLPGIQQSTLAPGVADLQNQLTNTISQQLAAGSSLTPEQQRETEQYMLSAEQQQGIQGGQGTANRQAVNNALEGQNLLNQRIAQSQSYVQGQQQAAYDPFAAVLGRPAVSAQNASTAMQSGLSQPITSGQPINGQIGAQQAGGTAVGAQSATNQANLAASQAQQQQQQYLTSLALQNAMYLQSGGKPVLY